MNRMNTPYKQAKSERTNAYLVENYPSIITCGPITFSQSMKEKSYTICGPLCPHLSSPASSKQHTTRLTYNGSVTNVTFCAVVPQHISRFLQAPSGAVAGMSHMQSIHVGS